MASITVDVSMDTSSPGNARPQATQGRKESSALAGATANIQDQIDKLAKRPASVSISSADIAPIAAPPDVLSGAAFGDLPAPGAWTPYTPTVTTTMTTSGVSASGAYQTWGKRILVRLSVVVTFGGTPAALVSFSLPANEKTGSLQHVPSIVVPGGAPLQGVPNAGKLDVYKLSGAYATGTAFTFYCQGEYEAN